MLKDNFGAYEVTFNYLEPTNNKHYEMRKYVNSIKVKVSGGMYAIYCEEDQKIVFRRSEYLRDRSYSKFVDGKCEDAVDCSQENYATPTTIFERYKAKELKKKQHYSLPSYIDRTKLTEEEFNELRRLIKKGSPED